MFNFRIFSRKIFVLVFVLCSFVCEAQNLIQNHSCDMPLVNGEIPYWQEIVGTSWQQRSIDPVPFAGNSYFYAYRTPEGILKQEINITGYKCLIDAGVQYFEFVGYVRAFTQTPSDDSNIEIQFLNQSDLLLSLIKFGPYNQTTTWKKLDSTFIVPINSRKAVIILHSVTHYGPNNDGYYDELSLTPQPVLHNPYDLRIDTSICEGQTYLGYGSGGTFIDTLIASTGCDSIRTLNLIVKPRSDSTINLSICEGETYLGYSTTGTFTDTFVAASGCDSTRTLNLLVKPKSYSTLIDSICEGESFLGYTAAGTFTDTLVAANGCDSIRTLVLTINKKPMPDLGFDRELCLGDSLILSLPTFDSYLWQDQSGLNYFVVKQPGRYSVEVTNICGSGSDDIVVTEKICNEVFPTAFTPNNDLKNEYFKILGASGLENYQLLIYNRWGQKVFSTSDPRLAWDGRINGIEQGAGLYSYYCEYEKRGVLKKLKGNFVLMR